MRISNIHDLVPFAIPIFWGKKKGKIEKKGNRRSAFTWKREGNREKRNSESKASTSCACQFTRGTSVDRRGAECHRVAERERERGGGEKERESSDCAGKRR